jgi:thiol:disulfide interchange protein
MKPGMWPMAPLLLLALWTGGSAAAAGGGKTIHWQTDLAKAEAQAARQKKILMVDFYADW